MLKDLNITVSLKGGKTKIKFPIPFDIEEPMNSGGCEGMIEKEQVNVTAYMLF